MKTRQTETMSRAQLLFLFLRGSKRYYLLAILGSLFVTLTEMITPQIIKITVDSVIGDAPLDAPFMLETILRVMFLDVDTARAPPEPIAALNLDIACVAIVGN